MNKKIDSFIFFLLFVICSLLFVISPKASAQSPSPKLTVAKKTTSTPTESSVSATPEEDIISKLKQIEDLKEKIATKVAQLRDKEKGAVSGIIKKIEEDRIILTTRKDEKTFVFSDDVGIFKLSDNTRTEITKSKFTIGDHIAVFGYYNEDKSILSAKYMYVETPYTPIVGRILDVDKSNFTITVREKEGNEVIDIEAFTKMTGYTKEKGKTKLGFSKLKAGDLVHVRATPHSKEKDRYIAQRIIILPAPTLPSPTLSPKPTIESSPVSSPTSTKAPKPTPTKKAP